MHCSRLFFVILAFVGCVGAFVATEQNANAQKARPLAPGVLKTIPIYQQAAEAFSLPMPMPGLNATEYQPKTLSKEQTLHGQAHRVILYRDNVWELEFSFIGLRQAKIKIPTAGGKLVEKNIWYLVYRIRNTGKTLTFAKVKQNPEFDHVKHDLRYDQPIDKKIDFRPQFTLSGLVANRGKYRQVSYTDVVNPVALYRIQQLEDPNQRLLDSQQMAHVDIPMAKNDADPGVWGVAIFEDVNPNIDFARVYVKGLSNAFRLNRQDVNIPSKTKTLQLNFYRAGDVVGEKRDDVDYGVPLVDKAAAQIEICKRYNLPGPVLRGYEKNKLAEREVLVAETDAQIDLDDFSSQLISGLDAGKLPAEMVKEFSLSGFKVDQNAAVSKVIPGEKWIFNDGGRDFVIQMEPQYWEPDFGEIRFIKTLDHIWIYR